MKKGSFKRCAYCNLPSSVVGSHYRKFYRTCKKCKAVGVKIENNWWWFRNASEAGIVLGPCYLRKDIQEKIKEGVV